MFKIKFPLKEKEIIMQTLGIKEEETYEIVLAPCSKESEADKINLIFQIENLDQVKEKINFFSNTSEIYLEGETYRGDVKVSIKDINYIESYGNEITAFTNNSRIDISLKLYELSEQLEPFGFCRISKSQIVNVAKIEAVDSAFNGKLMITLENEQELEVNRSYKKAFREYLKRS